MERTTKKEVWAVFYRLVEALEAPLAGGVGSPGLALDHNSAYGGWVIVWRNADTSESRPFGHSRKPAREFVAAMHLAIDALDFHRVPWALGGRK